MPIPATTPPPTEEFSALEPRENEAPMDALARVGENILNEFGGGDDAKDSRKNKKMPKQLAALVGLRAQGFDNKEIADRLGVTPRKLTSLIAKARKEYGWSDLGHKLANVALPKAVDNIVAHLDREGEADAIKDGQSLMTRTFAAGMGVFKTHSAVKQTTRNENLNLMRIEISMPQLPEGSATGPVQGVLAAPRRAALRGATEPIPPALPAIEGEVVNA